MTPRIVIAQRKDGVVLFLIIKGGLPGYSTGASLNDVIVVFSDNLDGGASSTMSIEG